MAEQLPQLPRVEELALMYERVYVLGNQTTLIEALIGQELPGLDEDFSYDNVENYTLNVSGMDVDECLTWLDTNASLSSVDERRVAEIRRQYQCDQAGEESAYDEDTVLAPA